MKCEIHPESLEQMRQLGGNWAAYQDKCLDSSTVGHLQFLKFGEGCTFTEPPKPNLPGTATRINWRYQYVGIVDLAAGEVREVP